jgi:hypothetical protein
MVWGLLAVIILIGGYIWYINSDMQMQMSETMGTYEYVCEGGMEFTMSPSADISAITLAPGANATFAATTLGKTGSETGAVYEGSSMVFVGAGEDVSLSIGEQKYTCNPKPNTDMAPWNWGDSGEGGGSSQPDAALVVGESIVGKWQSTQDPKSVREFKEGDKVVEWYDNETVSQGLFVAFTKKNAPEVPYPLEDNAVYLQLTETGSQADTMYFKVVKLTPEELELVYMDRGGTLTYKLVK